MNIRLRLKADTRFSNTQTRDHLIQRCCVTSWLLTQVFTYFSLAELIGHNASYWVSPLWKLNNWPATSMIHLQLYNSQCCAPERERESTWGYESSTTFILLSFQCLFFHLLNTKLLTLSFCVRKDSMTEEFKFLGLVSIPTGAPCFHWLRAIPCFSCLSLIVVWKIFQYSIYSHSTFTCVKNQNQGDYLLYMKYIFLTEKSKCFTYYYNYLLACNGFFFYLKVKQI